jgi:NTE family protein
MEARTDRIGIALGGGSARGWAHIGVMRALAERGVVPEVVCGTSMGALVGALYAAGHVDRLEQWARALEWRQVVGYFDLTLSGGLVKGKRLFDVFSRHFPDRPIESMPHPYGAVATDLESGLEVWLREGPLLRAVRASIAIPGIFTPVQVGDRWLVDGGLVNPVPVSLCRAMGATLVIGVDLNSDLLDRNPVRALRQDPPTEAVSVPEAAGLLPGLRNGATVWKKRLLGLDSNLPSIFDVITRSINIMQVRITRSRMVGEPPDLLVMPRLAQVGLMEFHRAEEAIAEGRRAVEQIETELERLFRRRAAP